MDKNEIWHKLRQLEGKLDGVWDELNNLTDPDADHELSEEQRKICETAMKQIEHASLNMIKALP